jgi:hypothetical protein
VNVERITKEYLAHLDHQKKLEKMTGELKALLRKAIEQEGEPDESGHRWLAAGSYLLKLQKSQGQPKLDPAAAEEWARSKGIWDKVKETVEVLDEDKLMAYMYDHQADEDLEEEFQSLYVVPDPVYSFIRPIEQEEVDY